MLKIKNIIVTVFSILFLLVSCNDNKKIMSSLKQFDNELSDKRFHFGDQINLPQEVISSIEKVSISFGDVETSDLIISPKYFKYGYNDVTFNIKTKSGGIITKDATINIYSKTPEEIISYNVVHEYPHDPNNFLEGLYIENNTVYESVGLLKVSKLIKYNLGSLEPIVSINQPEEIFSEGCAVAGNKIYQLTYQNRIGIIYDKNSFKKISEFTLPAVMREGWGITYDGQNLIATDGSNKLFFLDTEDPSKVIKTVSVAGHEQIYDQLNELEYHDGFIYSNIWHQPFILKINYFTGEVVGKLDLTQLTNENNAGDSEHVLNGIAFNGNNMIISGKNWAKMFELIIK